MPQPCAAALLLGLCIAAATSPVRAQEEDTEEAAPRRWQASAELSYTDQSGTRLLRVLNGGLKASHLRREAFRLDASLQSRYGESDAGVVARNHYGSVALDLQPRSTWSPFLFADAEHDRFKRLEARVSSGAGVKYTPFRAEAGSEASFSLAALLSYENLTPTEDDPFPDDRLLGRWSLRLRGIRELNARARVHHVTFYQPLFDRPADYLLRTETGARASLIRRLALSVVYQYNRTALPPEGVAPDERVLRSGLIIDF